MIGLLGTFVNMIAVILGGSIGMFLGSRFPKKLSDSLMKALGLCTLLIGVSGLSKGENQLITIISITIGITKLKVMNMVPAIFLPILTEFSPSEMSLNWAVLLY